MAAGLRPMKSRRNALPSRVGEALRRHRVKLGVSQEPFASAIARGRKNLRLETLDRLAQAHKAGGMQ